MKEREEKIGRGGEKEEKGETEIIHAENAT